MSLVFLIFYVVKWPQGEQASGFDFDYIVSQLSFNFGQVKHIGPKNMNELGERSSFFLKDRDGRTLKVRQSQGL